MTGSANALSLLLQRYPTYKPALRKEAVKYFMVVTDDDSDVAAQDFINQVDALDAGWFDEWRFSGVYCTGNCPSLFACISVGGVYADLVTRTAGTADDLCQGQSGFGPLFSALANDVVSACL